MAKHVQQIKASGTVKATNVAESIVERLVAEVTSHCFGVAGDYVFPICDAVDNSAKVNDGHARIRGGAAMQPDDDNRHQQEKRNRASGAPRPAGAACVTRMASAPPN